MTDSEVLALVLVAVHVVESLVWVRPGATAFRRRIGGGVDVVVARAWSAFSGRAFLLGPLVPPLRGVVVSEPWPLCVAPEGVAAWPPDGARTGEGAPRFVAWGAIESTEVAGREIHIDGEPFAVAGNAAAADALAGLIADAADASDPAAYAASIVDASLDEEGVSARVTAWEEARGVVSVLAHGVFALVAVAVAMMAWRGLHPVVWLGVLALALPLHVATVWAFVRAHRRLHPDGSPARRGAALALLVSPMESAHADTALARDVAPIAHVSLVASVLREPDSARELAAAAVRRLRLPLETERPRDDAVRVVWEWHRGRLADRLVERLSVDEAGERVLSAAPAQIGDARAWCPRCRALYARDEGACSDCPGVSLQRF